MDGGNSEDLQLKCSNLLLPVPKSLILKSVYVDMVTKVKIFHPLAQIPIETQKI